MTKQTTVQSRAIPLTLLALLLAPQACTPATDGGGSSTGGSGASAQGGSGGGNATGGSTSASGGSTGTGGSTNTGGSTGTGGANATGGSNGTGGSAGGGTSGSGGSSGTGGGGGGSPDASGSPGANDITGMYGTMAIKPVMSGLWIGKPGDPTESGGGPFVALFSAPVTCADISQNGWIGKIPAGTQVMELIIGTTEVGKQIKQAGGAAAGVVEVNYTFGGTSLVEHKSTSGNLTLTSYKAGVAVDGMLDINFGVGTAKGGFHAVWCANGVELGPP